MVGDTESDHRCPRLRPFLSSKWGKQEKKNYIKGEGGGEGEFWFDRRRRETFFC